MATQTIDIRVQDKTGAALGNIDQRLKKVEGSLLSVGKIAGLAAAALGAIGGASLVRSTVQTIRTFEDLKNTLITIEGNAGKAALSMKLIEDFTAGTTFQLDEVTNAFITFKNAGLKPTTEFMTNVGNIAAGMGKRIDTVSQAIFNATTGEFEMLKQLGIKVKTEGDKLTVNFRGTATEIENDGQSIIDFIEKIGETEFAGSLERQANTLSGAISNLEDNVSLVQKAFGDGGFKTALTEFVKFMQDGVIGTKNLAESLGEEVGFAIFSVTKFLKEVNFDFGKFLEGAKVAIAVLGGAGLVAVLKKVTLGIKSMTLAMARNPLGLLAVAAASLITYLSMENGLGRTIAQVSAVMKRLGEMAGAVGTYFKNQLGRVIDFLTGIFDSFVDSVISGYNAIARFVPFLDEIESSGAQVRGELQDLAIKGFEYVQGKVEDATEAVVQYIDGNELAQSAMEASKGVLADLTKSFQDAGLSYDEANAKAREQYDALVAIKEEAPKVSDTQQALQDAMEKTAKETAKATANFKKFKDQIDYMDPKDLIAGLEATEKALREGIKLQTKDLEYYTYRATLISNNRILFLSAEEAMFKAKEDYTKRIDELEQNAMRRKMENFAKEKGAIADLAKFTFNEREKGILQNIGGQDKLRGIIDNRIEFEKKSEMEKYQFGIQQAGEFFSALGTANKKAFEAAKAFNIANAIMNTYAGATKALASYPPPFNFIAAAAVVASGLAQVSAIRSQQYTGRQRGGALQIGQGTVVGEDGPEIIVPKQPGTVIPREVAEAMNGMNRGSENVIVNFNINTVDAQGFDDLLIQRRGTITGIINQALQKRGKQGVV